MPFKDKKKQREYQRKWRARRRAAYFRDKVCAHCGTKRKIELHHLNPTLKESHKIWSWSKKRLEIELKKCTVLCEDCHAEVHRPQRQHGTRVMYQKGGCRCKKCREAQKLHMQKYRR